jgi:hypothetical protein
MFEEPLGGGDGSTELDARADVECRPSRGRQRLQLAGRCGSGRAMASVLMYWSSCASASVEALQAM